MNELYIYSVYSMKQSLSSEANGFSAKKILAFQDTGKLIAVFTRAGLLSLTSARLFECTLSSN
jgi:hypothetical protein